MTGVPVGFINASLGGSRMESWLGREMIEDEIPYPQVEDRDLGKRSQEDYEQAKEAMRGVRCTYGLARSWTAIRRLLSGEGGAGRSEDIAGL